MPSKPEEWSEVLEFWFPEGADGSLETFAEHMKWCMRGGADDAIVELFRDLTRAAAKGDLDLWARAPAGRLALIVVLDQFSRSVFRGTPDAYAQDEKALALAEEGLANGDYEALADPWRQTFFVMPLGHCEGADLSARLDRLVDLADDICARAPEHLEPIYQFSRQQPREHRRVIARFGRHPHRNAVLGRASTPEEAVYLAEGKFPHQRAAADPRLAAL